MSDVVASGGKFIVVDDTSPSMVYYPAQAWNLNISQQLAGPYNQTLHTIPSSNSTGSRIDFDFTGSTLSVEGVVGTGAAPCKCSVYPSISSSPFEYSSIPMKGTSDGTNTSPSNISPSNRVTLCANSQLPPGRYRLSIEPLFNNTGDEAFWVDFIMYKPIDESVYYDPTSRLGSILGSNSTEAPSLSNGEGLGDGRQQVVFVFEIDADIHYRRTGVMNLTEASITFNGSKISAITSGASQDSIHISSASYIIDEAQPVVFQLERTVDPYGLIFETSIPGPPDQQHTLRFNYTDLTPVKDDPEVGFHYLQIGVDVLNQTNVIGNGSTNGEGNQNQTITNQGSTNQTTGTNHTALNSNHRINKIAIAGGVTGGILLLLIISLLGFFIRQRNRKNRVDQTSRVERFYHLPNPVAEAGHHESKASSPVESPSTSSTSAVQIMGITGKLELERQVAILPYEARDRVLPAIPPSPPPPPSPISSPPQLSLLPPVRNAGSEVEMETGEAHRVVVHQDSGIRIPDTAVDEIVIDVPPTYTAS